MKNLFSTLFLIAAVLVTTKSHAGIYLEPYAGYSMGTMVAEYGQAAGTGTVKFDHSGLNYGARLGWQFFPLFFVAADYQMISGAGKVKDQPAGGSAADWSGLSTTNLGGVLGVKIPLFQIYAGYVFKSDMTAKASGAADIIYEGNGMKLGLGYTGLPFVAINLEYFDANYTKFTTSGSTNDLNASAFYKSVKHNAIMLNVGLPFRF